MPQWSGSKEEEIAIWRYRNKPTLQKTFASAQNRPSLSWGRDAWTVGASESPKPPSSFSVRQNIPGLNLHGIMGSILILYLGSAYSPFRRLTYRSSGRGGNSVTRDELRYMYAPWQHPDSPCVLSQAVLQSPVDSFLYRLTSLRVRFDNDSS